MFRTWRDEWRNTPEPHLWRAILFAVGVIVLLSWPLLHGKPRNGVPAVLASVAALAVMLDLARLGWSRLRR